MFRWKKLGKVFDPKDLTTESWMHEFAQSPSWWLKILTCECIFARVLRRP